MPLKNLTGIIKNEIPAGCLRIQTGHGSEEINLCDSRRKGFTIKLDEVDKFIEEIKKNGRI